MAGELKDECRMRPDGSIELQVAHDGGDGDGRGVFVFTCEGGTGGLRYFVESIEEGPRPEDGHFRVKWVGHSEPTWEPRSHVEDFLGRNGRAQKHSAGPGASARRDEVVATAMAVFIKAFGVWECPMGGRWACWNGELFNDGGTSGGVVDPIIPWEMTCSDTPWMKRWRLLLPLTLNYTPFFRILPPVHLFTLFSRPSQRPFTKLTLDTNGSLATIVNETRVKRIQEMMLKMKKLWKKEQAKRFGLAWHGLV